jgi:hypothetical protein
MYPTFPPFRLQPPSVVTRTWPGFFRELTARSADRIPLETLASLGLRLSIAGSPRQPAELSSFSYGPTVHLELLSTSLHKDAVTLGYGVQTQLRQGLAPCRFDTLTSAQRLARWAESLTQGGPVNQGVALRWNNCWAFGPPDLIAAISCSARHGSAAQQPKESTRRARRCWASSDAAPGK